MYRLEVYRNWLGWSVEVYSEGQRTYPQVFWAFKKASAIKKAKIFIDALNGPARGFEETIYYSPGLTEK